MISNPSLTNDTLDSIGEIPLQMQLQLSFVLIAGTFETACDSQPKQTDICVIAATDQNRKKLIQKKSFPENFYYCLKAIPINIRLLRNYSENIAHLAIKCLLTEKSDTHHYFLNVMTLGLYYDIIKSILYLNELFKKPLHKKVLNRVPH